MSKEEPYAYTYKEWGNGLQVFASIEEFVEHYKESPPLTFFGYLFAHYRGGRIKAVENEKFLDLVDGYYQWKKFTHES